MRVSSAFATRWYEEWEIAQDAMLRVGRYDGKVTEGERKAGVVRFLDAMAPALTRILLEPPTKPLQEVRS
jgi:hypothetical protein